MKKVLITGGAGFIGYHLANHLLLEDYHVDLLDNFSRGVKDKLLGQLSTHEKVNLIDIDLLKFDSIHEIGNHYNYIYHLAAVIGVQHVLKAPYDGSLEGN